jgi:hypothetical protein
MRKFIKYVLAAIVLSTALLFTISYTTYRSLKIDNEYSRSFENNLQAAVSQKHILDMTEAAAFDWDTMFIAVR